MKKLSVLLIAMSLMACAKPDKPMLSTWSCSFDSVPGSSLILRFGVLKMDAYGIFSETVCDVGGSGCSELAIVASINSNSTVDVLDTNTGAIRTVKYEYGRNTLIIFDAAGNDPGAPQGNLTCN